MRDIKKGEEITTDYAFFVTSNTLTLNCQCGSPNCRGVIRHTDWQLKSLQKKYKKYFQIYIQEKIKNKSKR